MSDSADLRLVRLAVPTSVALLVLAAILTLWNFASSAADRARIAAENRVVLSLERLLSATLDIETGSRGYVLAGQDKFLEPYRSSLATLKEVETNVKASWLSSDRDANKLNNLFNMIDQERLSASRMVAIRDSGGIGAAQQLAPLEQGKVNMDAIRASLLGLQAQANDSGLEIERREQHRSLLLTLIASLTAFAACGCLGWLAWVRRQQVATASYELAGMGDRFRTLADNMPQLAWMADKSGQIYWYNQRWYDYTGLSDADLRKDGWKKAHDPEMVEGVSERFVTAIKSGEDWQDTFPLLRHDGEYRWFLSLAQPIRDAKGDIIRWFGTNTDVTEQRLQREELAEARDTAEEANRAKSQFLANMSHELRTPLSAVIGYSEMLEEEVEEMGQQHLLADLSKIKSNARHLLSLINDVLDISKIEANKMEIYSETFDVAHMTRNVASTVGSLMGKKQNAFVLNVSDDLGTMHSDVVKIRQVLINLLSNAAKFTENGEVGLEVRRQVQADGDLMVFAVRDNGLGMTEEQVGKLFQRFTQADVSTTRRFGGTGLGLAITKAFTDMLGGQISIASEPGKGSRFEVAFPVDASHWTADTSGVSSAAPQGGGGDLVLVIDDDHATRDLLSRFLSREGFAVRVAEDGRTGLALAKELKPGVILLDVTMPRMDGWSVLRSLKEDPHLSAIPVVMCTIIDEQNLGFSLGASDYILKPVNWEHLKEVLARVQKDAAKGDVLVVEDDEDTRSRIRGLLAKDGWTVAEAENGRAALEAVAKHMPSVVLLDLNMPEMDGFTFLRQFRASADYAAVPVIVMTARDLSVGERAELKGGGARILQKGKVGMRELVEQLRAVSSPESTLKSPLKPAPKSVSSSATAG
jgi:PAS domain S-box-containing protein